MNFITLYVVDKSLMASYVLKTVPNTLHPSTLERVNYSSSIVGDAVKNPITFLSNYTPALTEKSDTVKFPMS